MDDDTCSYCGHQTEGVEVEYVCEEHCEMCCDCEDVCSMCDNVSAGVSCETCGASLCGHCGVPDPSGPVNAELCADCADEEE